MKKKEKIIVSVLGGLVVVLAVVSGVLYKRYVDVRRDPQKYVQDTSNDLIKKVGQLIDLPAGEAPTIATVVNLEKLKGQPFFEHASLGDKVLIYAAAKKVYLFNPNTNRIVEVAPLSAGNSAGIDSSGGSQ